LHAHWDQRDLDMQTHVLGRQEGAGAAEGPAKALGYLPRTGWTSQPRENPSPPRRSVVLRHPANSRSTWMREEPTTRTECPAAVQLLASALLWSGQRPPASSSQHRPRNPDRGYDWLKGQCGAVQCPTRNVNTKGISTAGFWWLNQRLSAPLPQNAGRALSDREYSPLSTSPGRVRVMYVNIKNHDHATAKPAGQPATHRQMHPRGSEK